MKRWTVASSNLAGIGWEPGPVPWIGTLEIEFVSGRVYRYHGVDPLTAFRVLCGYPDGSVGSAFNALIKYATNTYEYERIE